MAPSALIARIMPEPHTISHEDKAFLDEVRRCNAVSKSSLRKDWDKLIEEDPRRKTYYETEFNAKFHDYQLLPSQLDADHVPKIFELILVQLLSQRTRRVLIEDVYTLADLHDVIVAAFRFDDDHLHEFILERKIGRRKRLSRLNAIHIMGLDPRGDIPDADFDYIETEVRLWDVFPRVGRKLRYVFDFGEEIQFDIMLGAKFPQDPSITEPVLIARNQVYNQRSDAKPKAKPKRRQIPTPKRNFQKYKGVRKCLLTPMPSESVRGRSTIHSF